MKRRTLTEDLADLERTNPAVAKAAANADAVSAEIVAWGKCERAGYEVAHEPYQLRDQRWRALRPKDGVSLPLLPVVALTRRTIGHFRKQSEARAACVEHMRAEGKP